MRLIIQRSIKEEIIISGCRKKHSRAQKLLFEKYAAKMSAVCRRYIKDPSEAESVMIGGFIKVFEKILQYKGDGIFEGWVRKIMINESLIYLRKNRYMYLEVDISNADYEPDYDLLNNRLDAEDLMEIVQKLPEGYRTVFNLYAIEGFTHKEIGEKLEINVNTSKSQLSRARKLLQKYLQERELWEKKKMISYEKLLVE